MFKKRCVKIGVILLVIVALIGINTNIFGAINEKYYDSIVDDLNVVEGALDSKVKGSILLDAVSILVYAVGSLMEWVLGLMFEGISGSKIFPWADAILFNAVPLLDINVFNPSGASLVGIMQKFIASSYWTIFSLALSFLGIAIMVTAIKLVVSTIASDKALYKQAIMKWLMGFIMLWGIHFFMSFVLYLNEGLVETASKIAQEATAGASVDLTELRDTSQTDYDTVYNFVDAMVDGSWNWSSIIGTVVTVVAVVAAVVVVVVTFVPSGGTSAAAAAGAASTAAGAGAAATAATGWAAFAAGVAKFGSVALTVGKIALSSTAIVGAGGLGAYLISQGMDSMTQTEFVSLQYDAIEAIRSNVISEFENGTIFDKFPKEAKEKLSGSAKEKTVQFLFFEDSVSIASRLLRNDNYVNSMQTRVKEQLRADSEKMAWKDYNDIDMVYALAADVYLIMNDKYEMQTTGYKNGKEVQVTEEISYQTLLNNYMISIKSINSGDLVIRKPKDPTNNDWSTTIQSNNPNIEAKEENVNYDQMLDWYCQGMTYAHADYKDRQSGGDGVQDTSNIISTLAKAFKEMAWTNTSTSWKPSKPVIQGALMYAILVAQSLIFFIAYAKRLFYVIILILVAPVIVVYDFFTKFSS